ncbi:menaquinone-dependent protoporphyrinogen IX dehydrogenase [Entomomonas asaccharolytica]|uniref:Protoporphyrinogen IX dehydrogenase [quinone] n=1 Tax=Entomomonas asaccharolytica TaxID=2785331 RepID=A0A974RVS8_9GAMM|nr:menaquinone-dependent protoporphyrinogen IX dehydrogenase [Entomomonas asaccharolytica]QQP84367.1 menaquinone-dependent protoporphyrinogen IX dehydrogenase [Entomomonas asaccharolytica]
MKNALLLYSTIEGQTLKIMERIAKHLSEVSPEISYDLYNIEEALPINLNDYETILIGGSIRYGHFRKPLLQFIEQNTALLNSKKTAFFCVCVTARKAGKDTPEGSVYARKLFQKIQWQPNLKGVFAGALYYPRYNWFDRTMIRLIMWLGGEKNHDMTQNYSYTNWHKVDDFAQQFSSLVIE